MIVTIKNTKNNKKKASASVRPGDGPSCRRDEGGGGVGGAYRLLNVLRQRMSLVRRRPGEHHRADDTYKRKQKRSRFERRTPEAFGTLPGSESNEYVASIGKDHRCRGDLRDAEHLPWLHCSSSLGKANLREEMKKHGGVRTSFQAKTQRKMFMKLVRLEFCV